MVWKPAEDPLTRLAKTMVESAQHVWFSSISSVLTAQQEIAQQLTELLPCAAISGLPAKALTATCAGETAVEALDRETVQALAEQAFESRLMPLLQRGNVANRTEIERLTLEVETLTRRVEALCRESGDATI